jgi:hypothetical protein
VQIGTIEGHKVTIERSLLTKGDGALLTGGDLQSRIDSVMNKTLAAYEKSTGLVGMTLSDSCENITSITTKVKEAQKAVTTKAETGSEVFSKINELAKSNKYSTLIQAAVKTSYTAQRALPPPTPTAATATSGADSATAGTSSTGGTTEAQGQAEGNKMKSSKRDGSGGSRTAATADGRSGDGAAATADGSGGDGAAATAGGSGGDGAAAAAGGSGGDGAAAAAGGSGGDGAAAAAGGSGGDGAAATADGSGSSGSDITIRNANTKAAANPVHKGTERKVQKPEAKVIKRVKSKRATATKDSTGTGAKPIATFQGAAAKIIAANAFKTRKGKAAERAADEAASKLTAAQTETETARKLITQAIAPEASLEDKLAALAQIEIAIPIMEQSVKTAKTNLDKAEAVRDEVGETIESLTKKRDAAAAKEDKLSKELRTEGNDGKPSTGLQVTLDEANSTHTGCEGKFNKSNEALARAKATLDAAKKDFDKKAALVPKKTFLSRLRKPSETQKSAVMARDTAQGKVSRAQIKYNKAQEDNEAKKTEFEKAKKAKKKAEKAHGPCLKKQQEAKKELDRLNREIEALEAKADATSSGGSDVDTERKKNIADKNVTRADSVLRKAESNKESFEALKNILTKQVKKEYAISGAASVLQKDMIKLRESSFQNAENFVRKSLSRLNKSSTYRNLTFDEKKASIVESLRLRFGSLQAGGTLDAKELQTLADLKTSLKLSKGPAEKNLELETDPRKNEELQMIIDLADDEDFAIDDDQQTETGKALSAKKPPKKEKRLNTVTAQSAAIRAKRAAIRVQVALEDIETSLIEAKLATNTPEGREDISGKILIAKTNATNALTKAELANIEIATLLKENSSNIDTKSEKNHLEAREEIRVSRLKTEKALKKIQEKEAQITELYTTSTALATLESSCMGMQQLAHKVTKLTEEITKQSNLVLNANTLEEAEAAHSEALKAYNSIVEPKKTLFNDYPHPDDLAKLAQTHGGSEGKELSTLCKKAHETVHTLDEEARKLLRKADAKLEELRNADSASDRSATDTKVANDGDSDARAMTGSLSKADTSRIAQAKINTGVKQAVAFDIATRFTSELLTNRDKTTSPMKKALAAAVEKAKHAAADALPPPAAGRQLATDDKSESDSDSDAAGGNRDDDVGKEQESL